ncbi:MAG: hypothetical protein ACRDHY_13980 [Anaerolineales bacterium]
MQRRPFLLLGVVVICFSLGLISVLVAPQGAPAREQVATPPAPTRTADPAASSQVTVLVVGVDRLDVESPRLRAVWLASFRPPGRELFFLGLPVTYRLAQGFPSLAEQFSWTPQAGPGEGFLAGVHTAAPQEIQVIAALDDFGFASLIDYAGGINLNGVPLRGDQALAVLGLLENDPSAMLSTQARLLQALIVPAAGVSSSPDVSPLIALIPAHAFLSESFTYFAARLSALLPLDPSAVHVDLLAPAP